MKNKLLIGWMATMLGAGVLVACGDDDGGDDDGHPSGGKAGSSAGTAGANAGKGGSAGGGTGGGGTGGGKAGGGGAGNGGKSGKAGGGGTGGKGVNPGGAGGEGGEAGSTGGESGNAGQGGQGGQGGEGPVGGEAGLGGESGAGSGETAGAGNGGEGGAPEVPLAVLHLNEINSNINNNVDLIELRVITGGDVFGITVEQVLMNATVLATLPHLVVAANDLVVVHLNAPGGVTNESTGKDQCVGQACFDEAWDVRGGDTGLVHGNRVITVRANGAYQDAVPFVDSGGTEPAAFLDALTAIQTASQWTPAMCGGMACTYATTPSAVDISVDWADIGTTAAGDSVQVTSNNDNSANQWEVAPGSFGLPNPT